MDEPTRQSRRPRSFQFSLRTLLVLVLVVFAYFAGFATSEKLARKAIQDARDKAAAEMAFQNQAPRTRYYPLIGPMPEPPLTK